MKSLTTRLDHDRISRQPQDFGVGNCWPSSSTLSPRENLQLDVSWFRPPPPRLHQDGISCMKVCRVHNMGLVVPTQSHIDSEATETTQSSTESVSD